jgi:hypothetical protein
MLQWPDNFPDWLSLNWFHPATLLGFEWARPFFPLPAFAGAGIFHRPEFLKAETTSQNRRGFL